MAADHVFTTARGDRAGVDDVIVVITDGHSNVRKEETEATVSVAGPTCQTRVRGIIQ